MRGLWLKIEREKMLICGHGSKKCPKCGHSRIVIVVGGAIVAAWQTFSENDPWPESLRTILRQCASVSTSWP